MSSRAPESYASALLTHIRSEPPLPLHTVARALGLEVRGLPCVGFEGVMFRHRKAGGIIAVRAGTKEYGRHRFTIAHEIGHYILHGHESATSLCALKDIRGWDKSNKKELAANRFAAELLLPKKHIIPILKQRGMSMTTVEFVKEQFQVSLTSAALRCVELSESVCALIISKNDVVEQYRKSKSWPRRYSIRVGTPIPEHSLASTLLNGKSKRIQGSVNAVVWLDVMEGIELTEIGRAWCR